MIARRAARSDTLPLRFQRGVNLEPECEVVTMAAAYGKSLRPKHFSARALFVDIEAGREWLRANGIQSWVRCNVVPYQFVNGWQNTVRSAILRLEIDLVGRNGLPMSDSGRLRTMRFLAGVKASSYKIEWQRPNVPRCYQTLDAFEVSLETSRIILQSQQYKDD